MAVSWVGGRENEEREQKPKYYTLVLSHPSIIHKRVLLQSQ